jgi:hypothetical protein
MNAVSDLRFNLLKIFRYEHNSISCRSL